MNKRPRDDHSFASAPKRQYGAGGGYGPQQGYSEERSSARRVADHYSARSNQTLEERENSPIIHLKKLNNWIKSVLVQLYARPGDCVLDLACGKGGDLIKWDKAKVGYYVGVDIAEGSFALHYSWSTEARARQALANVSALLRPGGIFIGTMPDANVIIKRLRESEGLEFGNSVYWISFGNEYAEKKFPASRPFGIKYKFHLEDAVDCPEWVVPFHLFKLLAEEYDLELVLMKNFHEFVHEYLQKPEFAELMRRLGALGDGRQDQSTLSQDEWEVSYLYLAFVLRKVLRNTVQTIACSPPSTNSRSPFTPMAVSIELTKEYGYVVLVLVAYVFLNLWMGFQVGKARRNYKVFYPTMYAIESENKDAKLFNCVQRGHQNSLEWMPVFFVILLLGGLQHPTIAAGLGGIYIVARFFYFKGYATGVPDNRLKIGGLNYLALLGLIICTASFGINLLIREML
ncbi:mRNA cap guanine-N7 methyltransferase 1 [Zea mays]|uniref:Glutathione S-transferase 3, mitochondrial n=2 Tax=Zea mays TaxID=4577 RepID=A0A317Y489_MAIZE|nr:mRNA cap guanine-N7 methyltransferase 1 [Zea mays]